jgi:hypothetical protein
MFQTTNQKYVCHFGFQRNCGGKMENRILMQWFLQIKWGNPVAGGKFSAWVNTQYPRNFDGYTPSFAGKMILFDRSC